MITAYPLTKANRLRLARAFRDIPRVDLAVACVLEDQMGAAWADDPANPSVFKIELGPFAYLAGDPAGAAARELLAGLKPHTLLMPSAPGWREAARALYAERLIELERYSFSAASLAPEPLGRLCAASRYGDRVVPMDAALAASLWGREHFVDLSSYDSAGDFLERGAGFYVPAGGRVAGAAWASLACSRGIEVSVYVVEKWQRQGMATSLCSRLLLWCLERGLEPHWDAANPESARLAAKLGYTPAGGYTADYLAPAR